MARKKGKMDKEWLKEAARDSVALGGLAFFVLVLARALIGPYWNYVYQLLVALAISSLLALAFKNPENHIARAIILAFFTILFYNELKFTIFAIIIVFILLVSLAYLKIDKIKIMKGIFLGIISTIASYYLTPLIIKAFSLPI